MSVVAPISVGELLDKITILEIKLSKIGNPGALKNIRIELDALSKLNTWPGLTDDMSELRSVNLQLWQVEDELRGLEKKTEFGPLFVTLARSVYKLNDRRSEIKRRMNLVSSSVIVEEKSYQ